MRVETRGGCYAQQNRRKNQMFFLRKNPGPGKETDRW